MIFKFLYYIHTVLILAYVCSMSSQANRPANRQEEIKAETRKLAANNRKIETELVQAMGKIGNDDPRKQALRALHELIRNWSKILLRETERTYHHSKEARGRINRERNKQRRVDREYLDKRIISIMRQLNDNKVLQRIKKNSKDLKKLQEIIKELREKIGAAETMTNLGSGSGSGSTSRKRPRGQLKL